MNQLILSLFPGIGLLDMAFEAEGFVVVRGPDVLWGGDIRRFHPPAGRFDGVIGGPPCQCFSRMQNINRSMGREPSFPNLIPEFERCVADALPRWFLMENVPEAPSPWVESYDLRSFTLNNRQCIDEDGKAAKQNRIRKIIWAWRDDPCPPLLLDIAMWHNEVFEGAAISHATSWSKVNQRPEGSQSVANFKILCRKQGLPDGFDLPPFTVAAKCKAVGNGVPLAMGRALARAVKEATESP